MKKLTTVDEYIKNAPANVQPLLKELRELIKKTVPEAVERISYGMPSYDYKGRLVYFANMKKHIGLYIPPPTIAEHAKELANYVTTKSAIHLPLKKIPVVLVKRLILARVKYNEAHSKSK